MSPRLKKTLVLLLKVAVLVGIVEYARRQSQVADELAVLGAPTEPALLLDTIDGRKVTVARGTRLRVIGTVDELGSPVAYRATTLDGAEIGIAATDVEGGRHEAVGPRFALLPGMRTLFANLDFQLLALAFLTFGPPLFLMAVRWRVLLAAGGVDIPFFTLLRLHYMGFFFNTFMPGGAGGDIVKAVYVTRQSSQKTEAATIVLVDRAVGLAGILMMAGTVVLLDYDEMRGVGQTVGIVSAALTVGAVLYYSAWFRKLIRYDLLLSKLPRADMLQKIDAALYGMKQRKGALATALALSVFLQLLEVFGIALAGRSLGLYRATAAHYLAFVPIGYLFNALPLSFGGIGLMEGAYLKLFRDAGVATATQGFMLGVLARLIVIGWSLLGAASALFPPQRAEAPANV
ncbi:MAG TPA: lysylphosphatidylglycerol synthase transmembrane domain-containing protein [Polyangiaceae bacterium]|nr:lysylphosphatidylglycerol synthase transmembrane domain-containing protein [Polyangiaceae bacterium]